MLMIRRALDLASSVNVFNAEIKGRDIAGVTYAEIPRLELKIEPPPAKGCCDTVPEPPVSIAVSPEEETMAEGIFEQLTGAKPNNTVKDRSTECTARVSAP